MFGKILKGAVIVGGVYLVYKVGYAFGLKKADPVLQQLEKDLSEGKIDIQEYLKKYQERIEILK
jgi:hypothetical protein